MDIFEAIRNNDTAGVERHLAAGADPNARNAYQRTPLHNAIDIGWTFAGISLLLAVGADPNAEDGDKDTPLHCAARRHGVAIPLLLAAGADVAAKNNRGDTPLHIAAFQGKSEGVVALIKAGADINTLNHARELPVCFAVWYPDILEIFLAAGADPNTRNADQQALLHRVVQYRYPSSFAVRILLNAGADVDIRDRAGDTPLHIAARCATRASDKLLEAGADAALKNHAGEEPQFTCADHLLIQQKHRERHRTPPKLWRQILWTLPENERAKLPEALRAFKQTSLARYD